MELITYHLDIGFYLVFYFVRIESPQICNKLQLHEIIINIDIELKLPQYTKAVVSCVFDSLVPKIFFFFVR